MPSIEIPVELNTPICVVKFNQHDGAWIEAELFSLKHLSIWGIYAFQTYSEAEIAMNKINRKEGR